MQHKLDSQLKRQLGAISVPLVASIIAAVLAISIAIYFLVLRSAPEQGMDRSVPPTTAEERGDSARVAIAELKQEKTTPDLATAYAQATEHRAAGRLADAQLLYFFAARGGHAPAAFDLATMNDPAYFDSDTSAMSKPDPFQAYKWYKQARDGGHAQADARIAELRAWATNAARDGDSDAERLIISMGTR